MAGLKKVGLAGGGPKAPPPLLTAIVPIDKFCVGDRWSAQDETAVAKLVAIIAMGQATYAGHVIAELLPAEPAFTHEALCREAKVRLTVQEKKKTPRTGYPRWQRDGFIFEAISWIAARQTHGESALLKDPHTSATAQGLDGLMIELTADKAKIARTTVFEDKCTEDPRNTFLQQVMPALLKLHGNHRSAELVASASVLLRTAGITAATAAQLSAAVMDRSQRRYRAAFALTAEYDSLAGRQALFDGYHALDKINAEQRVGAGLIVPGKLRDWFDGLALKACAYLDALEKAKP